MAPEGAGAGIGAKRICRNNYIVLPERVMV